MRREHDASVRLLRRKEVLTTRSNLREAYITRPHPDTDTVTINIAPFQPWPEVRPSVLQVAAAVCLLLGFPFLGAYGQQSPATAAGRFFFHGTSNTSGNVALGTGKIGPSSVHGFGAVSSHGSANAAAFNLTGFVFCSGGPP